MKNLTNQSSLQWAGLQSKTKDLCRLVFQGGPDRNNNQAIILWPLPSRIFFFYMWTNDWDLIKNFNQLVHSWIKMYRREFSLIFIENWIEIIENLFLWCLICTWKLIQYATNEVLIAPWIALGTWLSHKILSTWILITFCIMIWLTINILQYLNGQSYNIQYRK